MKLPEPVSAHGSKGAAVAAGSFEVAEEEEEEDEEEDETVRDACRDDLGIDVCANDRGNE